MITKMIKKLIKSFFTQSPKWTHREWNERELKQKRICEKWSVSMLAEYYSVNENEMREVLNIYFIR